MWRVRDQGMLPGADLFGAHGETVPPEIDAEGLQPLAVRRLYGVAHHGVVGAVLLLQHAADHGEEFLLIGTGGGDAAQVGQPPDAAPGIAPDIAQASVHNRFHYSTLEGVLIHLTPSLGEKTGHTKQRSQLQKWKCARQKAVRTGRMAVTRRTLQ